MLGGQQREQRSPHCTFELLAQLRNAATGDRLHEASRLGAAQWWGLHKQTLGDELGGAGGQQNPR